VPASPLQLRIEPTLYTAQVVSLLRRAQAQLPCGGSLADALRSADPDGLQPDEALAEARDALRVGALVFGHESAAAIGAQQADAAGVFDVAVYHLTGSPADVVPALAAFRRAAGPLLAAPRG
jgi:hypothetical protein